MRSLGILLLSLSCSNGSPGPNPQTPPDAGAKDAATKPNIVVAQPIMTPCPAGWTEKEIDGADFEMCEPYPSGIESCTDSEAHFVGEPGCTRIGNECPTGDFRTDLPSDRQVYFVKPNAPGGDGSLEHPFGTIAAALAVAQANSIITLAKGVYDEFVPMRRSRISIWGACPEETIITDSTPDNRYCIVEATAVRTELRDVTISDSEHSGVIVSHPGRLTMENVIVSRTSNCAITVTNNAYLWARNLIVRDTQSNDGFGRGMTIDAGGRVEVTRGVFSRNMEVGITASDTDSSLVLDGVLVHQTDLSSETGDSGQGLEIMYGATAILTRSVVVENGSTGIGVYFPDTHATLTDVIVRDTRANSSLEEGDGLYVAEGASLRMTRSVVSGNLSSGVFAYHRDTRLELEDVVISGTHSELLNKTLGAGLIVSEAVVTMKRSWINDNQDSGIIVVDGANLELEDATILATRSRERDRSLGRGLNVQNATVTVTRARIARNREAGVLVGWGTQARLWDVDIVDTLERECVTSICPNYGAGHGIVAVDATMVMERFSIRRSALCGVFLCGDSSIELHQGEVSGNLIGACIQVEGFDITKLSNDVIYMDNGTPLDTTTLPEPVLEPPF